MGIEGKKEGGNDDPLRPALNLEEMKRNGPDQKLCNWIKTLGKIRHSHPESIFGTYRELLLTNRQYGFARIQEDQALVVVVNNDENQGADLWVPVPVPGKIYENVINGEICREDNGKLVIHLPENGVMILAVKKS